MKLSLHTATRMSLVASCVLTLNLTSVVSFAKGGGYNSQPPQTSGANQEATPACKSNGQDLPVMNEQVLQWRASQPSGYRTRALISGTVDSVFPDATGHRHFSLKVGAGPTDHIEVIYNEAFGAMPQPQVGDTASACGDFIVATGTNNGYPPSPDGALIHWVHASNSASHDSGYVVLDGNLYGNSSSGAGN